MCSRGSCRTPPHGESPHTRASDETFRTFRERYDVVLHHGVMFVRREKPRAHCRHRGETTIRRHGCAAHGWSVYRLNIADRLYIPICRDNNRYYYLHIGLRFIHGRARRLVDETGCWVSIENFVFRLNTTLHGYKTCTPIVAAV